VNEEMQIHHAGGHRHHLGAPSLPDEPAAKDKGVLHKLRKGAGRVFSSLFGNRDKCVPRPDPVPPLSPVSDAGSFETYLHSDADFSITDEVGLALEWFFRTSINLLCYSSTSNWKRYLTRGVLCRFPAACAMDP
jgi:hypothetical protein